MSLPTAIVPATDKYRLALLAAFANATPIARQELAKELAHQRNMDKLFIKVEIGTLIGVGVVVAVVLGVGITLLISGNVAAGVWTLVGDALSTAGVALGRSYFIDNPRGRKRWNQVSPELTDIAGQSDSDRDSAAADRCSNHHHDRAATGRCDDPCGRGRNAEIVREELTGSR